MPLRAGVQRLESGDQDRLAVETPVPRPLGSRCVSLLTDLKCDIQTFTDTFNVPERVSSVFIWSKIL